MNIINIIIYNEVNRRIAEKVKGGEGRKEGGGVETSCSHTYFMDQPTIFIKKGFLADERGFNSNACMNTALVITHKKTVL